MDMKPEKSGTSGMLGAGELDHQGSQTHGVHTFIFTLNRAPSKSFSITCNTAGTILDSLKTHSVFNKAQNKNSTKEIVIKRGTGNRGAVNVTFPCHLIEAKENITVAFIKPQEIVDSSSSKPPMEKRETDSHLQGWTPKKIVTFDIQTRGGKRITQVMENKDVATQVSVVCMYAYEGETVEAALRRDQRFGESIFKKNCCLQNTGNEIITVMSSLVDDLHGKLYQIILLSSEPPQSSQESEGNEGSEPNVVSANADTDNIPSAASSNVEHTVTPTPLNPTQTSSANVNASSRCSGQKFECKPMPDSEDILKILRSQFEDLLEQLKKRKKMNLEQVNGLFRQEYDKTAQSFSEVKKVKQLITLSASVCQIHIGCLPRGTGFLLLDRMILTNAHVVKQKTGRMKLHSDITVTFNFEDFEKVSVYQVEDEAVALVYGIGEEGRHLDYALLELCGKSNGDPEGLPPALLNTADHPPSDGGICIIGHPDGGVKKLDPCFIIGRSEQLKAVQTHISESKYLHVIQRTCTEEDWRFDYSNITYDSCFFHGSSGSPAFNDQCKLVGVHTGGYAYKGKGKLETRSVIEYAQPIIPILRSIKKQLEMNQLDITESSRSLLYELTLENWNREEVQGLSNEGFQDIIQATESMDIDE